MGLNIMNQDKAYAKYDIGKHTYGKPHVMDWGDPSATLKMGSFCSIGNGVKIYLGGNHHTDWITTSPIYYLLKCKPNRPKKEFLQVCTKGSVIVGHDVWIGANATILSGVKIGNGAVIGAQSVVSKDVPPYCIYAGNPAKVLKMRFSEEVVEKLEKIQWWHWNENKIKKNVDLLLSGNVEEFVGRHYEG